MALCPAFSLILSLRIRGPVEDLLKLEFVLENIIFLVTFVPSVDYNLHLKKKDFKMFRDLRKKYLYDDRIYESVDDKSLSY